VEWGGRDSDRVEKKEEKSKKNGHYKPGVFLTLTTVKTMKQVWWIGGMKMNLSATRIGGGYR